MNTITVLGASGRVGREIVRLALGAGHDVVAVSRNPPPGATRLTAVPADVTHSEAIGEALAGRQIILNALGLTKGQRPGVLAAGALAAVHAGPRTLVSVGAFGTGETAGVAGMFTRTLLRTAMRDELPDKVAADRTTQQAGGIVLHVGPMISGPAVPAALGRPVRTFFPRPISRATVAALMLAAALDPEPWRGQVVVNASRQRSRSQA